ncbi:MAG: phosphoglycerate kinase [Pseudomonadota bacterium]
MDGLREVDPGAVAGKRVLVRADLNVPMQDGLVSDLTRLERVVPGLAALAKGGARVVVLSHFGRPKGEVKPALSLRPIAEALAGVMGQPVGFCEECLGAPAQSAIAAMVDGDVVLLENLRFHAAEEDNDPAFAQALAELGDLYVNDAFSCAHRAHASTEAIAHHLPSFAGPLMMEELNALTAALEKPERPVAAVVGGAKVSTKIDVLRHLIAKVDTLIIGGGMANTFLHAQGHDVGASLCERDLADTARAVMAEAQAHSCELLLPTDGVVATRFEAHAPHQTVDVSAIPADHMMLDVGVQTIARCKAALDASKTLLWNGPMGAFEIAPFDVGTSALARHAAARTNAGDLMSIAGGGDTVAALNAAEVADAFSYLSSAGGAFLEWLEGRTLPGVAALRRAHHA